MAGNHLIAPRGVKNKQHQAHAATFDKNMLHKKRTIREAPLGVKGKTDMLEKNYRDTGYLRKYYKDT